MVWLRRIATILTLAAVAGCESTGGSGAGGGGTPAALDPSADRSLGISDSKRFPTHAAILLYTWAAWFVIASARC